VDVCNVGVDELIGLVNSTVSMLPELFVSIAEDDRRQANELVSVLVPMLASPIAAVREQVKKSLLFIAQLQGLDNVAKLLEPFVSTVFNATIARHQSLRSLSLTGQAGFISMVAYFVGFGAPLVVMSPNLQKFPLVVMSPNLQKFALMANLILNPPEKEEPAVNGRLSKGANDTVQLRVAAVELLSALFSWFEPIEKEFSDVRHRVVQTLIKFITMRVPELGEMAGVGFLKMVHKLPEVRRAEGDQLRDVQSHNRWLYLYCSLHCLAS
jgi:hypothetical protein